MKMPEGLRYQHSHDTKQQPVAFACPESPPTTLKDLLNLKEFGVFETVPRKPPVDAVVQTKLLVKASEVKTKLLTSLLETGVFSHSFLTQVNEKANKILENKDDELFLKNYDYLLAKDYNVLSAEEKLLRTIVSNRRRWMSWIENPRHSGFKPPRDFFSLQVSDETPKESERKST